MAEGPKHPAGGHQPTFTERAASELREMKAGVVALKHKAEHEVGLDHHAAPAGGPGFAEKVEKIFRRDDLKPYEAPLGNSQADRDLKAAMAKRDEGIAIANKTFDKHLGNSLRVLSDPNANAVECAKAFKDLASEVQKAANPSSLVKEIGTEVLDAKVHAALEQAAKKYPHEYEVAKGVAHDVKSARDGYKLGEKIDKDVASIKHDLQAMHTAAGKNDYAGLATASKHLYDHTQALHYDVSAAQTLVKHELAQAKAHPAGMQGPLGTGHAGQGAHAGSHGGLDPSKFSSMIVNNVPVTASPLDNVTPNAPATIAHGRNGYEVQSHAPGQQQSPQHQQQHAAHAGR